jgi:hypothetical protein
MQRILAQVTVCRLGSNRARWRTKEKVANSYLHVEMSCTLLFITAHYERYMCMGSHITSHTYKYLSQVHVLG